jgi:hypothetical protein
MTDPKDAELAKKIEAEMKIVSDEERARLEENLNARKRNARERISQHKYLDGIASILLGRLWPESIQKEKNLPLKFIWFLMMIALSVFVLLVVGGWFD